MQRDPGSRPEAHEIFNAMCGADPDVNVQVAPCCWVSPVAPAGPPNLPGNGMDTADTPHGPSDPADHRDLDRRNAGTGGQMPSSGSSLGEQSALNEPGSSNAPSSHTSEPEFAEPCNCNPRISSSNRQEKHMVTVPIAGVDLGQSPVSTAHWSACSSMGSCIQIFETYLETDQDPSDIWLRTRRLVVSVDVQTSAYQRCSDIWLPLADLRFTHDHSVLTLEWSDCTRWTRRPTGNYDFDCDRAYIPEVPNRKIKITFHDHDQESVQRFIDSLRIVYLDSDSQNQKRQVVGSSHLHVSDMRQGAAVRYRVASVTSFEGNSICSKLFVHKPIVDFDIMDHDPATFEQQTSIHFYKVRTPHYISSVVRRPNEDSTQVGRCAGVKLKISGYELKLPTESTLVGKFYCQGSPINVRH